MNQINVMKYVWTDPMLHAVAMHGFIIASSAVSKIEV